MSAKVTKAQRASLERLVKEGLVVSTSETYADLRRAGWAESSGLRVTSLFVRTMTMKASWTITDAGRAALKEGT